MIAVLTCHFNPCGYERPRRNYMKFRDWTRTFPRVVHANVQLVFDDDHPAALGPETCTVFATRERASLWQKEALLNIAWRHFKERHKAEDVEAVCWVDADVLLLNPDWPDQLLQTLETHAVAQLFTTAWWSTPGGMLATPVASLCAMHQSRDRNWSDLTMAHSGLAWGARTPWFEENKLYDRLASGCADSCMALALGGDLSRAVSTMNPELELHFSRWASRAQPTSLGAVPGDVVHMYHGSQKDRDRRGQRLLHAELDPEKHLTKDCVGVLLWTDDAPGAMREAIAERFARRKEDVGLYTGQET